MRNCTSVILGILTVIFLSKTASQPLVESMGEVSEAPKNIEEKLPADVTTVAPNGCSSAEFELCMAPMINQAGDFSLGGPYEWTAESLKKECSAFRVVKKCVQGIMERCSDQEVNQWKSLSSIMAYMCDEALNETLKYAQCNGHGKAKTDLQMCLQNFMKDQAAMLHSENDEVPMEAHCGMLEQYEECVIEVEMEDCGEGASALYAKIFNKINSVIGTETLCAGGNDDQLIDSMEDGSKPEPDMKVDEERCATVIGECLKPLEPHRTSFTKFRVQTIPQICSDFSTVVQCMQASASACEETVEWDIVEEAFQQICEPETFNGIVNATKCIGRSDVITKLRSCEKEELIADVNVSGDKTCKVLEEYVDCYSVTVDRECDERAGQLVSQVMTGVAQVIELDKEVDCEAKDDEMDSDMEDDDDDVEEDEMKEDMHIDTAMEDAWGELKQCLGSLADVQTSALPVHKFETLNQLCSQVKKAQICAEDLEDDLKGEVRNNWERLMATMEYVCEEHREEFNEIYGCLTTTFGSRNGMGRCYERRTDATDENLCRMVTDYEECVVEQAENNCGERAGQLFQGLMDRLDTLIATEYHMDCPFSFDANMGSAEELIIDEHVEFVHTQHGKLTLGIGLGLGVPVIILVIVVLVFVCKRRRGSQNLDKNELVKHEVLQSNLQLALSAAQSSDKDSGVQTLSISNLKV